MPNRAFWRGAWDQYEGGYTTLVAEMPGEAVLWVTGGDYQGDHYILLQTEEKVGLLVIGYGSCSGCDALDGCRSYQEIVDLYYSLVDSIRWGTAEEITAYLQEQTRPENDWHWYEREFKHEFVPQALAILDEEIA